MTMQSRRPGRTWCAATGAAALAVCAALVASPAIAADAFEQHAAHEHGRASLDVAVDGGRVEIRLESPAADVLGFERAPRTPQERQAIATAATRLGRAAFAFPVAAKCTAGASELKAPAWAASATTAAGTTTVPSTPTGAASGARGTAAGHERGRDSGGGGGRDGDGDRLEHADYEARWTFDCAVPTSLAFVDAVFVGALQPGTVVQANVITDALQTRQDLRAGAARVKLK